MKSLIPIFVIACLFICDIYAQTDPSAPVMAPSATMMSESTHPFVFVDNMPEFPGGTEAMNKFIVDNLTIPDSCRMKAISGMAVVQFTVDTFGHLIHPKVIRAPQPECGYTEESLRVISLMNEMKTKWSPGSHRGKKVDVKFTLPIRFVLN